MSLWVCTEAAIMTECGFQQDHVACGTQMGCCISCQPLAMYGHLGANLQDQAISAGVPSTHSLKSSPVTIASRYSI